jgi:uncharacterized protein (DUF488 family)
MVYTIGYEGVDTEAFISCLAEAGVELIVDVRLIPYSRKPGFTKEDLQPALARAGIGYVHMRSLGCPTVIRDAYKADGNWDAYTEKFNSYAAHLTKPLEELLAFIREKKTCLLCFEANPYRCHRLLLANRLKEIDPSVEIINLSPKKTEPKADGAGVQLSLI